mmetsp:Transcript_101572/g.262540  ORF Transcript_101572/g.262540 Transcript_101572/m.262540 type:complete len:202 (-) Transcript_101572:10-615(-)|eukprot:CAMPEP_0195055978 /NCGR_PEP_ID=MMETSP0448-20130528/4537_1 /TAXON_ID=66468 /ORGANISM="Heterocapsa triquestra, Strain CCMP 448" /LENGTH=201 /DNA_ID=CAMNT_0040085743 /DNA_START=75 /DNA_END=680 /DNA_ORIENTATION=+
MAPAEADAAAAAEGEEQASAAAAPDAAAPPKGGAATGGEVEGKSEASGTASGKVEGEAKGSANGKADSKTDGKADGKASATKKDEKPLTLVNALFAKDNRAVANRLAAFSAAMAVVPVVGLVGIERLLRNYAPSLSEASRWTCSGATAVILVNLVIASYVVMCFWEGFDPPEQKGPGAFPFAEKAAGGPTAQTGPAAKKDQ